MKCTKLDIESTSLASTTSETSSEQVGGTKKEMAQWRKDQKSVFGELGWGREKEGCNMKRHHEQWHEGEGRLICPDCGETSTTWVQEARHDYWYCGKCGFEGDIDSWGKTVVKKGK
jgi:predicted RNA-binding Zn-ribbon protein involved in translation (DUF1610 family)